MLLSMITRFYLEIILAVCASFFLIFSVSVATAAEETLFESSSSIGIQVMTKISRSDAIDQVEANSMLLAGRLLSQYIKRRSSDLCPDRAIISVNTQGLSVRVINNQISPDFEGNVRHRYEISIDKADLDALAIKNCGFF